jgi:para-aminobenzoate synthetase/4-amino-4-deoxychorismate lyase
MLIFDFAAPFATAGETPPSLAFGEPDEVIIARAIDEVVPAMQAVARATTAGRHAAGYVSYEAAPAFDPALCAHAPGALPLLWFGIYAAPIVAPAAGLAMYHIGDWKADTAHEDYATAIADIRGSIREGEIYQANYTLRLNAQFSGDAQAWYEDLRRGAHGHFNAYLDIGSHRILSMSPELFFAWNGSTLRTRPMKGTARRSPAPHADSPSRTAWEARDRQRAGALHDSAKNRAENLMIVDLLRNDVSRVAVPGSVAVPQLFTLEAYPTLYQMTSTVSATTRPGTSVADIFRALFPCGSITGAPKIMASRVIHRLESTPRGAYCGAIGVISPGGECVFNVAIRTIVVDAASGAAQCGVGGGITWDSASDDEHAEAIAKSAFMRNSSRGFELLETLRLHHGKYDWLERHLARLGASAAQLGFEADLEAVRVALDEHAAAHRQETRRVRLLLARDGGIDLSSEGLVEAETPRWLGPAEEAGTDRKLARLAASAVERDERALCHKTTRRAVYEQHRQSLGVAWDALLWNLEGELTEFTYGNLVVEIDGSLLTPALSSGLLAGVLRAELLARGVIRESVLQRADLARASRIWFINSVRGWVEVELITG